MKNIVKIILAFFILGNVTANGMAQSVPDMQKRELVLLVNALNSAVQKKDASVIVNNMPARLYQEMASRMQVAEIALRKNLQETIEAQFNRLAGSGYTLDVAGIRYAQTKDGMFYAFVPTRVETEKSFSEFMTLALYDRAGWHLIYGGQKTVQNPVFLEIYPAFADVNMPLAQVKKK